ncbi:Putative glucan endo-1,3-beta-glucosidase btgC [Psilocybe cubensis]|uniref:Glucan endo-1,3-beta-glucosidase btgC n=2 Tax=Psilocybe cubensis TaxID=181762 RepID=A0ACB8H0D2_PSICU|nr:Putative glucan endo-1,3-beta-glucosidase btgC [Psilocybe cubensis]KAH9481343.1 Putative glucan endo-1,3-beta-glucosidase btgC [Psilocybe cubensis]
MQAYRDNPFEPNQSSSDLNEYYQTSRSPSNAGRSQAGFNNIPLRPTAASGSGTYTPLGANQPFSAESTDNLASQNPFGTPPPSRQGMAAPGGYSDLNSVNHVGSSEPKLGAYTPGSRWMEPQPPKGKRKMWIIMGTIVGLIGIAVIAIAVGIVVSHNKKNNNNLSSSVSGVSSNSTVQQTDPGDPSKFTKDPNFHQAFWGMAYTPVGSQTPDCGNSLAAVIQDIQIMSQLTTRIRLYGADCNQSALVLEAIKQTKVNMKVWLGNYVIATDNNAAYNRQRDTIKQAIQTYGTDNIGGITVGNEFVLNFLTNGNQDPNSAQGDQAAAILVPDIQDTRAMLQSLGVSIPVGNSDAGSYFNNKILEAVDYGMANVHPWFADGVTVDASAAWTADFFQNQDVDLANTLPNRPQMYIAETGWPTKSSDAAHANSLGGSPASVAGLQTFLDTFVCQANANGTQYFFFEFADEDWKDKQFGGVEGWWGLFNQDRTLKNGIKIPNCQSP